MFIVPSYIVDFLDKFKATVYRQTMFAEFEYIINKKIEDEKLQFLFKLSEI